jgi:hypothetical protein
MPLRLGRLVTSCCLALSISGALRASRPQEVARLEETKTYDLRVVLNAYKDPLQEPVRIVLSPDEQILVTKLWAKGEAECQDLPYCVSPHLGLIELTLGRLVAQSKGPAPEFIAFSPTAPELLVGLGKDLAFVNSHDLSILRELEVDELFSPSTFRAQLVSADLAHDGRRVGALYRITRLEQTETPISQEIHFIQFDAKSLTVSDNCVVAARRSGDSTLRVKLEADAGKFFYASRINFSSDQNLTEYDLRACTVLRSWTFDQALTEMQISPDRNYIVLGLGGMHPKMKVRVLRYADGKEIWNVPAKSLNDMGWQISVSENSRWLAISTDRYGESWWDAFREMSHIDDPGVEVRDLETGRRLSSVRFSRNLPSTIGFSYGTKLVQFTALNNLVVLTENKVRFFKLIPN